MNRKVVQFEVIGVSGHILALCDDNTFWIGGKRGWEPYCLGPPSEHQIKNERVKDLEAARDDAKKYADAANEAVKRLEEQIVQEKSVVRG